MNTQQIAPISDTMTANPPASSNHDGGARKHFVVSIPTGFVAASGKFRNAIRQLNDPASMVETVASIGEESDKLVALNETEVRAFRSQFPSLTVEPNILYRHNRHPLLSAFTELYVPASAALKSVRVRVVDGQSGVPVRGAVVFALIDSTVAQPTGLRGETDINGDVVFRVRQTVTGFSSLIVMPAEGYWNRRVKDVPAVDGTLVTVRHLPLPTPESYDWGHEFSGMTDGAANGGRSVKVALIDTGVRNDHPDLRPAGGRNCVFGEDPNNWFHDEDGHGTHCAGVIASLISGEGIKGYAPAVELRAYRVFGTGAEGATTFDIAMAIQRAIEDGCDIISMSLGAATAQSAIRNKIELAYDRGVTCIAAVGNEAGKVSYPAAFPNVFGVSAFGTLNTYPADSLHKESESNIRGKTPTHDQFFLANFSNTGEQLVDFCAPGVAIRSTVPRGYSSWDGTSMACPHVAGMAALALASHPKVFGMPRDSDRVDQLEVLLRRGARPLGFGPAYEGSGALSVPLLV